MATFLPLVRPTARRAGMDFMGMSGQMAQAIRRFCYIGIGFIMLGVLFKYLGLTFMVWGMALLAMMYASSTLIAYVLVLTPPVWLVNLTTGTWGEAAKLPQGLVAANEAVRKLWRAWLWVTAYSAIAFIVIALFNIEDNLELSLPLLTIGLLVMIVTMALFRESNFFPWLVFLVGVGLLITMLAMLIPGNTGLTVKRWVDEFRIATIGDKAKDKARRSNANAVSKKKEECYNKLKERSDKEEIVPESEFQRCADIAPKGAFSTAASSAKSSAAEMLNKGTAAVDPKRKEGGCETIYSGTYIPGRVGSPEVLKVNFCEGNYQITYHTESGGRDQVFFQRPTRDDGGASRYTRRIDACGRIPGQSVPLWTADKSTNEGDGGQAPFPQKAYGAFVVWVGGKRHFVCEKSLIHLDGSGVAVDINTFRFTDNYGVAVGNLPTATGGIKYTFEKVR